MTVSLHSLPLGRILGVREAYNAIDAFGRRFGERPLRLLLHLGVPQSFRADLVNLIKINFVDARADLDVDAEVLFSPLVEETAGGFHRLDVNVRRHCLMLLDAAYRDQPERRSVQVAQFLYVYIENAEHQAAQIRDPLLAEYLAAHRWVALAFINPAQTAADFAGVLRKATDRTEVAARLQLGSVASAIEIPLAGQQDLLAYARGLDALVSGDFERGRTIMKLLGDRDLEIGGIRLTAPTRVLSTFAETAEVPVTIYSIKPGEQIEETLVTIVDRHEALLHRFYRNFKEINKKPAAKQSFVDDVYALLKDVKYRYTMIDKSERHLLYNIAQTWRSNLEIMLETTTPDDYLPFPPPPSLPLRAPFTELELTNHIRYLAQHLSEENAKYHPYMGSDPNRDWYDAEILLAKDVLVGTLSFYMLQPGSYWRLENIWLNEIIQRQLKDEQQRWGKLGEAMDKEREKTYLAALSVQFLVNPVLKAPIERFAAPRVYLLTRYIQTGMGIDIHNDSVKQLIERKFSKVRQKASNALESAIYDHVVGYVTRYYNNIIPAIEDDSKQAVANVINAFHLSQSHASESSIINAFEAALPIYFMKSNLIQEVWQTRVPRVGIF